MKKYFAAITLVLATFAGIVYATSQGGDLSADAISVETIDYDSGRSDTDVWNPQTTAPPASWTIDSYDIITICVSYRGNVDLSSMSIETDPPYVGGDDNALIPAGEGEYSYINDISTICYSFILVCGQPTEFDIYLSNSGDGTSYHLSVQGIP